MGDKKTSQLPLLENISGQERIPVAKNQQNFSILAGDLMKSEDTSNLLLFDSGMPTNGLASEGAEMNSTSSAVISKVYNASSLYFACSRIGEATSYTELGRLYVELKNDAGEVSNLDYVIPPNQTGVYFANLSLSPKIENPTSLKVKVTPTLNGAVIAQDISEMRLRIGDLTKDAGWEENPQYANSIIDNVSEVGCIENLLRYQDGNSTSFILDSRDINEAGKPFIEPEFEPLTDAQLAGIKQGQWLTVAFELELYNWYVDDWADGNNQLPKIVLTFSYEGGERQREVVLAKVSLETVNTGLFQVVHTFQLKDAPLTEALANPSYSMMYGNAPYPSGEGAYARLFNPRLFKGKVDYGWVESTLFLTEAISNSWKGSY